MERTCNSIQAQGMCLESNAIMHLSNGLCNLLLAHTLKHKTIKLIIFLALHHPMFYTAFCKNCSEILIGTLCTITPSQMFLQSVQST